MEIVQDVRKLRQVVSGWRNSGERIALVPTMGNLHAGHFALIEQARRHAGRVVATVFVNPTQFGPGEDFERYPRTPEQDAEGLHRHGCDLMFAPGVAAVYPFGAAHAHRLVVPALADVLCGAHRPGHFDGVATIVSRLYNLVQPDLAVFGEKDFQQLRILERMTEDLCYPIEVLRAAIVREQDGLALSSRNRYLDAQQRTRAPGLVSALRQLREHWLAGATSGQAEAEAHASLVRSGFDVDYIEIRREHDLRHPEPEERVGLRAFAAARLGTTRLIDNVIL